MDVKEALELAGQLLNRPLKQLEILIFEESWKGRKGRKYSEIADDYGCKVGTVNDAASDLWKLLSDVLGEKVSRNTLQGVLEKRSRSHSAVVPQPQEQAQEETPSKNTDFVGREEAIAASTSEDDLEDLVRGACSSPRVWEKLLEQHIIEPISRMINDFHEVIDALHETCADAPVVDLAEIEEKRRLGD